MGRGFQLKEKSWWSDPIHGIQGLRPEALAVLEFIADLCAKRKFPDPVVTCLGRLREDQERIYTPLELQRVSRHITGPKAAEHARLLARKRFSLHCLPLWPEGEPQCSAFDLRHWTFTDDQRETILEEVRQAFTGLEVLDHEVPGGARHLHFGVPWPARPKDWL